jgi:type IV secretory pathway TraG/TraD family ATPase VirD4
LGNPFDLHKVTECLDYTELVLIARETANKKLMKRVQQLRNYDMKDITGLQAHLNLLINSEMGHYFRNDESTFNLREAIEKNALVYFALPALQFPSFAKVLGKLVINDLKAVISNKVNKKVFTVFDEFSVFVSEQVRNLVNMGRGKGIHAVFGTQGLAELKDINPTLMEQILNCVNTLICHRVNDSISAQAVSDWVGTQNAFAVTAQLDIAQSGASAGSVRSTKEYIVHPDNIKQGLEVGEAYFITKVGGFKTDKVKVKFS